MGGIFVYKQGQNSKLPTLPYNTCVANNMIMMKSTSNSEVKKASLNFILFMITGCENTANQGLRWIFNYPDLR
jgi:hypothetical protein